MGFLELRRYMQAFVDSEDKVSAAAVTLAFTAESLELPLCADFASCLQLWTLCVRTKRGLVDTGRVGGYCKDQVSFAGLMQLLQNRQSVSFELLHSCKLPWECLASTPGLQRAREFEQPTGRSVTGMLVPEFIRDGETAYQRRLDHLVQVQYAASSRRAHFSYFCCSGQRSRPVLARANMINETKHTCSDSGCTNVVLIYHHACACICSCAGTLVVNSTATRCRQRHLPAASLQPVAQRTGSGRRSLFRWSAPGRQS